MTGKARIRRDIQTMSAYTPTTSLDVFAERLGMALGDLVKLDANENPFGPSPRVVQALANLPHIGVYPDPESGRLRDLLSAYTGVDASQILCGAGADELIEIILQLFIEPGDTVVNTPPTFAMYGFDAPLVSRSRYRCAAGRRLRAGCGWHRVGCGAACSEAGFCLFAKQPQRQLARLR